MADHYVGEPHENTRPSWLDIQAYKAAEAEQEASAEKVYEEIRAAVNKARREPREHRAEMDGV